jgi:hypothetical protein
LKIRPVIPYIGLSFFVCSSALAQAHGSPRVPSDHAPEKQSKTALRGCLGGGRGKFYIASFDGDQWYALTGNTSALAKYVNKEISVEGEEDVSTQPLPPDIGQVGRHSFEVVRVKVFDTPKPSLSPSLSNLSTWHTETNPTYGIKFAHPVGVTPIPASNQFRCNPIL